MSRRDFNIRDEFRALISLGLPMMFAQGGLMLMGLVDTFLIGKVSTLDMSAVGFGASAMSTLLCFGIGFAMGLEPFVAQAFGQGRPDLARGWFRKGVHLTTGLSLILSLLVFLLSFHLDWFGIDAEISHTAGNYLRARLFDPLFICWCVCLRAYFSGVQRARPVFVAVVIGNIVNAALDSLLLFGWFGLPQLGATGVGFATTTSSLIMAFVLYYGYRHEGVVETTNETIRSRDIIRVGVPVGTQLLVEVGIFALVAVLIGRIGSGALASHQIAITLASFTFMCVLGIGIAGASRVGFHIGADNYIAAKKSGSLAIILGGGIMAFFGLGFIVFSAPIAAAFTNDPHVQKLGSHLLKIAGVFSTADGVQAVTAGTLRGAKDTHWSLAANVFGHWAIALPLALYLQHRYHLGAIGYWWALTIGLIVVAILLVTRFVFVMRGYVKQSAS